MLNGRLYLHSWVIATVALLVAFLTLQPVEEPIDAEQVGGFNGSVTRQAALDFRQAAPLRLSGTVGARDGADWVTRQFQSLPEGDRRVAIQNAVVRGPRGEVPIVNVMFTVAAAAPTKSQRNILIVAPRDAPRQVSGGTSGTAILVELARMSIQGRYHHPLIFLSVDGDSLGNAGLRWYLASVDTRRIAGVIVLDAPAEGTGNAIHIWSGGRGRQALQLRDLAARAVTRAGFEADPPLSLRQQLVRHAVTETRGAQRAAIDAGVPAVTLAARPESPLTPDVPEPNLDRVRGAGNAAFNLMALLDARERANAPDGAFAYAGRILRPAVARLALLFLALPLFVMALDAAARVRRARVRVSAGLRAVAWRSVPLLVALLLGRILTAAGVLRAPDIGRAPVPVELPFDGQGVLALLFIVLSALAVAMLVRPRVAATGATPQAEAAAALLVLSVAVLLAWWLLPFALVLILPAVHAAVAAIIAPRVWQLILLGLVALLTPIAVLIHVGDATGRGVLYAIWYLVETMVSGARGLVGPLLFAVVVVALGSLLGLITFRVRKGLVQADVRKGLGWLTSNLSTRKRRGGTVDGRTAQEAGRRTLAGGDSRRC